MNIEKVHSFLKNLTLETVNKYVLLAALAFLFVRNGDFNSTLMPKPFEAIFVFVAILFSVDLIKNKKIKNFWFSIPKNIWLAVGGMVVSVLIGWSMTLFVRNFPLDKEMVAEFGRMAIALVEFLILYFYMRNDQNLTRKYFYALLSPVFYIVLLFIPKVADFYNLTLAGRFIGFTNNLNTTTKTLVVPAIFFFTYSLFEEKNKLLKFIYIAVSSGMTALLLWTSSRGGLLAFFISAFFVFCVFVIKNLSWKKFIEISSVSFTILFFGFLITPHSGKQVVLERALNADTEQIHYLGIKNKSLTEIVKSSLTKDKSAKKINDISVNINQPDKPVNDISVNINQPDKPVVASKLSETRLTIWIYVIKQIPYNLLGAGPAFNLFYTGTPLSGGTHNSLLQMLFEGGIVGLFCLGYILFKAFDNLKNGLISNFDISIFAISGGLMALLIALMFDANVKLFLFWALLAITINIKSGIKDEKR